jgi:hypothetical protein
MPVSRLWQTADQILHCFEGHPDTSAGGARKVLAQGAILPAGGLGWYRLTALGQTQPAGLRVAAQLTGKFLQIVPFAAHLGVLAGEGGSPGGLTSDGPATGAVQHQIGGARSRPVLITKPSG